MSARLHLPVFYLALLAATAIASACSAKVGGDAFSAQTVGVSVTPTTLDLVTGQTAQFTAMVNGSTDATVTWSVDEAGGGTIDQNGLYAAPATPGSYHLRATSRAAPEQSAVAAVFVAAPPAVGVAISPKTVSLITGGGQTFAAAVTGIANTSVTWSVQEASGCGTMTTGGVYTAPSAAATCHVVATSVADPTKSDVATVTVSAPAPVTVAISPKTVSLTTGGKQTFAAAVTGSTNTSVTWSVREASGCGSMTTGGAYTAPSAAATCHVVATSVADTTKSDVATVTVSAPAPVTVAVSPGSGTIDACKTLTFRATITGSTDQAVTWSVVEGGGGSITTAGVYTAPSLAGTYHVLATSHANPSATAQAAVTVQDHVLSVTVDPVSVSTAPGGLQQFTATITTSCGGFAATQTMTASP